MIGIVLAHSVVDYPLRTAAIVAVFAMGCALLIPAGAAARRNRAGRGQRIAAAAAHRGRVKRPRPSRTSTENSTC
jgi:hypothetical protein